MDMLKQDRYPIVSSPLDDLCIDIWMSMMIISEPDDKEIGYSNVIGIQWKSLKKIYVLKQICIFGSKCCAVKARGIVILRSAEREDYLGLGRAMHQAYTYTTLKPSLLPTPYPTFLPPTPRPHSDLDSFQKTSSCFLSLILRPMETTSGIHLILQRKEPSAKY